MTGEVETTPATQLTSGLPTIRPEQASKCIALFSVSRENGIQESRARLFGFQARNRKA
jgi:hypothetical protein